MISVLNKLSKPFLRKQAAHLSKSNSIDIWGFIRERKFEAAAEILLQADPKNCTKNMYTSVLSICDKRSHEKYALELLNKMIRNGVYPQESNYVALIRAYAEGGDVEKALMLIEYIRLIGETPRARTYSPILAELYRQADLAKFINTMNDMVRNQVIMQASIIGLLLRIYAKVSRSPVCSAVQEKVVTVLRRCQLTDALSISTQDAVKIHRLHYPQLPIEVLIHQATLQSLPGNGDLVVSDVWHLIHANRLRFHDIVPVEDPHYTYPTTYIYPNDDLRETKRDDVVVVGEGEDVDDGQDIRLDSLRFQSIAESSSPRRSSALVIVDPHSGTCPNCGHVLQTSQLSATTMRKIKEQLCLLVSNLGVRQHAQLTVFSL